VSRTERAGDGERIGRELRERWTGEGERAQGREVLVVLGGDGTVHEALNGLLLLGDGSGEEGDEALWEGAGRVEVVLLYVARSPQPSRCQLTALSFRCRPTGTANALYHHLFPPESPSYPPDSPAAPFYSLLSFLRSLSPSSSPSASPTVPAATLLPLPLALNELRSPCPSRTLTTVVSSAALHAALLHDAEQLRATHPGVERFKIAARQNVDRWWDGEVHLSGRVRRYDPATKAWVPATDRPGGNEDDVDEATTVVQGPFAYLVAALVSRFEPTFVVAPFRSPTHPLAPHPAGDRARPSIDIVAIRPLRHAPTAALERTGGEVERCRAREGFVERVWGVTGGMYDRGRHVDEVYGAGEAAAAGDEGRAVCEVWRAERVEWVPVRPRSLSPALTRSSTLTLSYPLVARSSPRTTTSSRASCASTAPCTTSAPRAGRSKCVQSAVRRLRCTYGRRTVTFRSCIASCRAHVQLATSGALCEHEKVPASCSSPPSLGHRKGLF